MTSWYTALKSATTAIASLPQASPAIESELLLCQILGCQRSYLAAWPERLLTPSQETAFTALIHRRLNGEPIAYILEQWEFWTLTLRVTPAVLIPRPETELLVELALAAGDNRCKLATDSCFMVVDLGTGSGAIAAAISKERSTWNICATDNSSAALAIATDNFQRLGLAIQTCIGCWYTAIPSDLRFDLILSNPPYIADTDLHLKQGDLPYEPNQALASGSDGLDAIRILCAGAINRLRPGGALFLEHGYNQGQMVRDLMQQAGFNTVCTWQDLAGYERITGGSTTVELEFFSMPTANWPLWPLPTVAKHFPKNHY